MAFEGDDPNRILFDNRVLFLFGEVTENAAATLIPRLLVLDSLGSDPIKLYINSPGGEMQSGLAIYDTMNLISAPVYTICIGYAASMAGWLLAAGAKGHRIASENSRIMIHQGRTELKGAFGDLKLSMQEFTRNHGRMIDILARHTGKTEVEISAAIEHDRWMIPEEALEFGIIDTVARGRSSEE